MLTIRYHFMSNDSRNSKIEQSKIDALEISIQDPTHPSSRHW